MASDKTASEKKYADACVQTSAAYQESRLATPSTSAKHVTYVGRSAPGVRTEESPTGKVYPRTPINLVRHSNAYKGLRQRDSPSIPQVERRLVSLPARFEENSLSEQLARSFATGARTVSMPTRLRRVTRTIAEQEDPSQHSMSFSSSEECYSASDFKVHFYDVPYTPSLLSDSNSFDATDDKLAMPHHYMSVHDAPEVPSKETQFDWVTWSESLPQPIPALHGPSSLPYARCPSGAEGTTIEEPKAAPGLIWGLQSIPDRLSDCEKLNANASSEVGFEAQLGAASNLAQFATERLRRNESLHTDRGRLEEIPANHKATVKESLAGRTDYENDSRISENRSNQPLSPAVGSHPVPSRGNHTRIAKTSTASESRQESERRTSARPTVGAVRRGPNYPFESLIANRATPQLLSAASGITNGSHSTATASIGPMLRNSVSDQKATFVNAQSGIPTPPNSSSPIWASGHSPLIGHLPDGCSTSQKPIQPLAIPQQLGLSIFAPPAASLEDLAQQLNQLVLQQRQNLETISALTQNARMGQVPVEQSQTDKVSNAIPKREYKPSMPISLPDLVASHIGLPSPAVTSPVIQTTAVLPQMDFDGPLPTECETRRNASPVWEQPTPVSVDTGRGKRVPRSVPFSRLLDKTLSPVKEESDNWDLSSSLHHSSSAPQNRDRKILGRSNRMQSTDPSSITKRSGRGATHNDRRTENDENIGTSRVEGTVNRRTRRGSRVH